MIIEELKVGTEDEEGESCVDVDTIKGVNQDNAFLGSYTKRILVGAGARALFYPTLLYNVVRNKFEPEFRWWDRVDEFIYLGAVPFPTDVPQLKELGVRGVITLNEPYETLVPTPLYHAHGIEHLVIPTRDYCFAPSLNDICQAVEFIHANESRGVATYVHCKAGRGRSTTIVLCYLVRYKQMTPAAAYDYVRLIRPRVLLASTQWRAVQNFYHLKKEKRENCSNLRSSITMPRPSISQDTVTFDDGSVVMITEADLEGYNSQLVWVDPNVVYRVRVAGQAALAGLSCIWLRCRIDQKMLGSQLSKSSCSIGSSNVGGISVNIHVC